MAKKKKAALRRSRVLGSGVYTLKDVCRILPLKRSQVEYWVRSASVTPQLPSDGTGTYRNFSFANLIELEVCRLLASAGFAVDEFISATELALKYLDPDDTFNESPKQRAIWEENTRQRIAHFGPDEVARQDATVDDAWAQHEGENPVDPAVDEAIAAEQQLWRRFKQPATRGAIRFYLIRSSGVGRARWFLVTKEQVSDWMVIEEQVHAINLKPVFERIEAATGDHWRTWKELATTAS